MSQTFPNLPNTNFPDSVDNFPEFLNMTSEDFEYVKQYQEYKMAGNNERAQIAFNNITNGAQKIISPLKMNEIRDAILAVQNFYALPASDPNNYRNFINNKHDAWDYRVNQFNYTGTYSPSTNYYLNNIILYSYQGTSNLYINVYDGVTPEGISPLNTTYWRVLTVKGETGPTTANDTVFMFDWNSSYNYTKNDIVTYGNGWWVATQNSKNQAPFAGSQYWNSVLTITQISYPIQTEQPEIQAVGELWFRVVE